MKTMINIQARTKQFEDEAIPHYSEIFRLARSRMRGNYHKAQDLTQDVFCKAWKCWESYEQKTHCVAWLNQILRTTYYDVLGQNYTKVMGSELMLQLDGAEEDVLDHVEDKKVLSPLEEIIEKEKNKEVYFAILSLPQKYYDVMYPAVYDGLSYREISQRIDCAEGTVKSRVFRGRELLYDVLKHWSLKGENQWI